MLVFSLTLVGMSNSSYVDWSRIYAIFENDNFSSFSHDHSFYMHIRNSQLHPITVRPTFMTYTNPIKWALDPVDLNQRMFNDIENVSIASFHIDVFARAYALATPKYLFLPKFFNKTLTKLNNE